MQALDERTLADRIAAGEVDEREWDPECREPEEDPPDEMDPELFAEIKQELDDWSRGPESGDADWADLELAAREEAGVSGRDLVNAARDAAFGDDRSRLSDAELIEQARALRALVARSTGRQYWILEEVLRRRPARRQNWRGEAQDQRRDEEEGIGADAPARPRMPVTASAEASEELALAFTLTGYGAETLTLMTADLALRLPHAAAGMQLGRLDDAHVKIIWEYTRDLSHAHAMKLDASLSPRAHEMTTGELRDKARAAQIRLDPEAAERRRKRNEKHAKLSLYGNDDHTANLVFEHVPAVQAAAAKARVDALARAMKAAGAKESLSLLQAKMGLGLLTGTLPFIPPPLPPDDTPGPEDSAGPDDTGGPDDSAGPDDTAGPDEGPGPDTGPEEPAGDPEDGQTVPWPAVPDTAEASAPGCAPVPAGLRPKNPGRIRLLAPWRTLAGMAGEPGDLSWFGAITPGQCRELARAAAADPTAIWRVLVTDDEGRALAITTLGTRRRADGVTPGLVEEVTVTIQASLAAGLDSSDEMREIARQLATDSDPGLSRKLLDVIGAANKAAADAEMQALLDADAGGCAHSAEVTGYRVPGTMRRWLCARDLTCRNPICRRRGIQCDMDHTLAFDRHGRTCTCNLGPLCRAHHKLKQGYGWHLEQEPGTGTFIWTTPAGLTYRKEPNRYPV